MEEYTLYLDESKSKKTFIIAGIIVKNSKIGLLDSDIIDAKRCIWSEEYITNNKPILHCVELTNIKNHRENANRLLNLIEQYGETCDVFREKDSVYIKTVYDNVCSKISKTIKDVEATIIGCFIDIEKLAFLYGNDIKSKYDLFFEIAMQEIIENYSHFLSKNNAIGDIIYESRNGSDATTNKSNDSKMFKNFCKIKVCNKGITYVDEPTLSKTIRFLEIYNKKDNISGLQLADFVSYNIFQKQGITVSESDDELTKRIINNLYNGTYDLTDRDLRDYFGLKIIPFDFQKKEILQKENKKMKNSLNSLKRERNNLINKNKLLTEKKEKLIQSNEELKRKNRELTENMEKLKNGLTI